MIEIPDYLHGTLQNSLANNQLESERKCLWAVILKLVPFLDGDKWCVLYGENLQVGISGFGETPIDAMCAFDRSMTEKPAARKGDA